MIYDLIKMFFRYVEHKNLIVIANITLENEHICFTQRRKKKTFNGFRRRQNKEIVEAFVVYIRNVHINV